MSELKPLLFYQQSMAVMIMNDDRDHGNACQHHRNDPQVVGWVLHHGVSLQKDNVMQGQGHLLGANDAQDLGSCSPSKGFRLYRL